MATARVREAKPQRMEGLPTDGLGGPPHRVLGCEPRFATGPSVDGIGEKRMTRLREVHPYLVSAPGVERHFGEGSPRE